MVFLTRGTRPAGRVPTVISRRPARDRALDEIADDVLTLHELIGALPSLALVPEPGRQRSLRVGEERTVVLPAEMYPRRNVSERSAIGGTGPYPVVYATDTLARAVALDGAAEVGTMHGLLYLR